MTTGAKKQLVGSLIEYGEPTRQIRIIADEVVSGEVPATFTDGDTSPSVGVPNKLFKTANTAATTISTFDDGYVGQEITIAFTDANTTIDFTASSLKGNAGVDWTPAANDCMRCIYDGTDWFCLIS